MSSFHPNDYDLQRNWQIDFAIDADFALTVCFSSGFSTGSKTDEGIYTTIDSPLPAYSVSSDKNFYLFRSHSNTGMMYWRLEYANSMAWAKQTTMHTNILLSKKWVQLHCYYFSLVEFVISDVPNCSVLSCILMYIFDYVYDQMN